MRRNGEIEAEVHLLVDFLAFVNVAAHVGEFRFHLGVRQLQKGFGPEKLLRRFKTQIRQRLVVGAAHFAVDLEEARQQDRPSRWDRSD